MSIGFRPKGGDGPNYSPQRDLAYITPTILAKAMDALDESCWTAKQRDYFDSVGLTGAAIGEAIDKLAESQRFFVEAVDVQDHVAALKAAGFVDCDPRAQDVVMAAIGNAVTAAWFHAVREVTRMGEVPFSAEGTSLYMANAKWIASKLGAVELPPHAQLLADKEHLNTVAVHNGLRISMQSEAMQRLRAENARLLAAATAAKTTAGELNTQLNELKTEGLWARIRRWWRDTSTPRTGF